MSTRGGEPRSGCGEDAAPYVLGALSEQEAQSFGEHLRGCASCREEVAELQAVANALPAAVPQRTAPPDLRARVLHTVRGEAELRAAGEARARPERQRRGGFGSARRSWELALGGLAAAALVVLVTLVLASGSGTSTRVIQAQTGGRTLASLRLSAGHGQLVIAGMPASPPGHVYEVWVQRAGVARPTDALFTVTSAGRASVGVPGSLTGASAVMVTAEPDGGSSHPTSAPVLVARL
ncbi:MAG TPA: anti-sigma factor [Solirubrobacteraceae bacterium]|jgi:anti-sigma-K factor RskA|nr:anti-sigma factor [Solirubrobacteraceae bacterium]